MRLFDNLYDLGLSLLPATSAVIVARGMALCYKSLLSAGVALARLHPEDAGSITRRAIEIAILALAAKHDELVDDHPPGLNYTSEEGSRRLIQDDEVDLIGAQVLCHDADQVEARLHRVDVPEGAQLATPRSTEHVGETDYHLSVEDGG